MKISLWVVIRNENLVSLSYFQGINGGVLAIYKKNLFFLIISVDFLNVLGYYKHINEILLRLDFYNVQSEENSNMRYR